jgi:CRP-like cAMP-binding protein
VALTAASVASLPGRAVRSLAGRDAALALRLFDLAMSGSMEFEERLDQVYFDVARKRLARILLTYEPLISSPQPIISRADLAGLIETSREMLGNAIRALEAEGTVRRKGRQIAILRRAALEREAELEGKAGDQDRWFSTWYERRPGRLRVS